MAKRQKRGKTGNVAQYLTRTKAVRKLQLRLSEFRRLCILKGIHPREPKKKVHGANKTYYHIKDINWLMHEPLLQVFRNMKSHDKKVRKAYAKFNPDLAQRLKQLTPTYKLDHLVKERYPSFVDALRDLDDALTMVHLFATLPAEKRLAIPNKAVQTAQRLALEWNAWLVRTSALRKVFVSVKGIYFQAEVLGQSVTWLIPHQLAQVLPTDVDYKVMLTFLEFYECLLQFVNFKLYHTLGLKYPPVMDAKRLEQEASALAVVMRELAGVRDEEGRAADAAIAALRAADTADANKRAAAAAPAAAAAARLQQLDAATIATLAGTITTDAPPTTTDKNNAAGMKSSKTPHNDNKKTADDSDGDSEGSDGAMPEIDSGSEDSEVDSEAGSDDSDDGLIDGSEEEAASDEGDADGGEEGEDQLAERRATGALAQTRDAGDDAGEAVAGGALGHGVTDGDDQAVCASLLKGLVFYLAREVPREPLALVIRAFGGVAAWEGEGSPLTESDESITHQVVDRPTQGHKFLARHYVQPQWVFDCANFRVLLPSSLYAPGKVCPPHLSPFVNDEEEGYTPDWAKEVKKLQEAARAARDRASGLAVEGFVEDASRDPDAPDAAAGAATDNKTAGDSNADISTAEIDHYKDLAKELKLANSTGQKRSRDSNTGSGSENGQDDADVSDSEGEKSESDEEGMSEDQETDEEGDVAAKVVGGAVASLRQQKVAAAKAAEQSRADEGLLKDVMMTRKNRKLYERINRAREGKRQRIEQLEERKAALEKGAGKGAGKKKGKH